MDHNQEELKREAYKLTASYSKVVVELAAVIVIVPEFADLLTHSASELHIHKKQTSLCQLKRRTWSRVSGPPVDRQLNIVVLLHIQRQIEER